MVAVSALFCSLYIFPMYVLYYSGLAATYALFIIVSRKYYPFDERGKIQSIFVWYALRTSTAIPLLAMLGSKETLFWYPTDSSMWSFVPYAILGWFTFEKMKSGR
jgi:hypothetical protein